MGCRLVELALVLCALFPRLVLAQDPQQSLLRLEPATGDYVIDYEVGGEKRRFVFTPATGVRPLVRSSVTHSQSDRLTYEFFVANDASASQPLYSFSMPADSSTSMQPGPSGWEPGFTGLVNRAGWYKRREPNGQRRGIMPGDSAGGFAFTSVSLPGPATGGFRGPTGAPSIPADFPDHLKGELYEALRELLGRDTVDVAVISAVIPGLVATPALTLGVFLQSIEQRYVVQLGRSKHPGRFRLLAALRDSIDHAAAGREREARQAVARALAVPEPSEDSWAEDLDQAFRICLRYAAKVPLAGSPKP